MKTRTPGSAHVPLRGRRAARAGLTVTSCLLTSVACTPRQGIEDATVEAWSGDFELGPHAVGFRTDTLTRPGAQGDRLLVLNVWYPAESGSRGTVATVADYFDGVLAEGQLSETEGLDREAAFAAAMTGSRDALTAARAREGLGSLTLARIEATPAEGPFPIALWSSRHATLLAQAPLSEVLASHGFVTATVWSSDPPLAFLWEDRTEEEKLATIEAHTGDLERALVALALDPIADRGRVLVLAWSYGGQTAARLQEREEAVRGVIALDANVVPARPEESLELRRPLAYLVGSATSGRGFERLESLTAPWVAVRFSELAHGSFNAMEGYLPATLGADTVYSWSQTGPVARDGYRALVRVTTVAAQALVTDDQSAFALLPNSARTAARAVPVEVIASPTLER